MPYLAEHIQPRRKCYTAGWGTTSSGGSISTNLQAVGLWIFEQDYCSNTGNAGYLDDSMFCAGVPDLDGDGMIDGGKGKIFIFQSNNKNMIINFFLIFINYKSLLQINIFKKTF